jgi:hypothetical protein
LSNDEYRATGPILYWATVADVDADAPTEFVIVTATAVGKAFASPEYGNVCTYSNAPLVAVE